MSWGEAAMERGVSMDDKKQKQQMISASAVENDFCSSGGICSSREDEERQVFRLENEGYGVNLGKVKIWVSEPGFGVFGTWVLGWVTTGLDTIADRIGYIRTIITPRAVASWITVIVGLAIQAYS